MITILKDFNNIPISRTISNNIEINVPVKVIFKIYKSGGIIMGDLFTDDIDKRVFVISNDIICEIVNRAYVKDDKITNVIVIVLDKKDTSGCSYFLARG